MKQLSKFKPLLLIGALGLSTQAAAMAAYYEAPKDTRIPGQYIVVMKEAATAQAMSATQVQAMTASKAARIAKLVDGKVVRTYHKALYGFLMRMDANYMAQLRADPDVDFIEQDQIISINAVQSNATWGLDRLDQPTRPLNQQYQYETDASGVNAYIIDTGIQLNHNEFGGRAQAGFTAIQDGNGVNDCNGHGTHVAGTVGGTTYGVAKKVNLYAVRVLGCDGSGSNSGVIDGVEWVAQNAQLPAVANMSLGGGPSAALDAAVRKAISKGVSFAVAAGNETADACQGSPNAVAEALTVGATNKTDARASFSNWGSCVNIMAPGQDITSAWIGSTSKTNTISGTSMASPHVAGVAALYLADHPAATPAQVFSALVASASNGVVSDLRGSPNRLLQVSLGNGGSQPAPQPEPQPQPQPQPEQPAVVELVNGAPVAGISGKAGENRFFTMNVPGDATALSFTLTGGTGDADMYVRFGQQPTESAYDCRPFVNGNEELCEIGNLRAGTWHVMVNGWKNGPGYTNTSLTGRFDQHVNEAPTASFTHTADALTARFDASSSVDADGTIRSYVWNFGNGQQGTGAISTVTYAQAGTYTVTLTVMDNEGADATLSKQVTVTAAAPVTAPCSNCELFSGRLNGAGDTAVVPNGSYFQVTRSGTREAWLQAPAGASYQIQLLRWTGSRWAVLGSQTSNGNRVGLRYSARSGFYAVIVQSNAGAGEYNVWLTR